MKRNGASSVGTSLIGCLTLTNFETSNDEFVSVICRRNTVEDPIIPKYNSWMLREDPSLFQCACDGGARPKFIDPCGYHFVGCKTAANAIRLRDEVVAVVARLFRPLRLDVIVEPTSLELIWS